jgi:hypothetical protein
VKPDVAILAALHTDTHAPMNVARVDLTGVADGCVTDYEAGN